MLLIQIFIPSKFQSLAVLLGLVTSFLFVQHYWTNKRHLREYSELQA